MLQDQAHARIILLPRVYFGTPIVCPSCPYCEGSQSPPETHHPHPLFSSDSISSRGPCRTLMRALATAPRRSVCPRAQGACLQTGQGRNSIQPFDPGRHMLCVPGAWRRKRGKRKSKSAARRAVWRNTLLSGPKRVIGLVCGGFLRTSLVQSCL